MYAWIFRNQLGPLGRRILQGLLLAVDEHRLPLGQQTLDLDRINRHRHLGGPAPHGMRNLQ